MMSSQLWQILPKTKLLLKVWGDEHIVYNPSSGHTHLLNLEAANLLKSLTDKPKTAFEMARSFSIATGLTEEVKESEIEAIILQLQKSSLIEPY